MNLYIWFSGYISYQIHFTLAHMHTHIYIYIYVCVFVYVIKISWNMDKPTLTMDSAMIFPSLFKKELLQNESQLFFFLSSAIEKIDK